LPPSLPSEAPTPRPEREKTIFAKNCNRCKHKNGINHEICFFSMFQNIYKHSQDEEILEWQKENKIVRLQSRKREIEKRFIRLGYLQDALPPPPHPFVPLCEASERPLKALLKSKFISIHNDVVQQRRRRAKKVAI